jgi:diguanylate cyclase (GGDEF)-like protein
MRETDEVGRLGGDEFVLLLRNADEREAKRFLDRLIETDLHIDVGGEKPIPIDFSAGVVQLEERFHTARDWLIEADVRMYANKTD